MDTPPAFNGAVSLTNRCSESKSPYVRSHVDNPTAWQLWTPETLELARRTNRLLFVSIGYSACHWCHVMAHESFDDPRVAQLLNEHFIPIKIDREERPDIDRQYMDFLQATSGGGGWPLNVFVTPQLEPIYGGTYWPGPKSERAVQGGVDFEQILMRIAQTWKEKETQCRESAEQITRQLREFAQEGTLGGRAAGGQIEDGEPDGLELDLIEESYQHYKARYDPKFGGFGSAPKFPTPVHVKHLLRLGSYGTEVREVVGEAECIDARAMAVRTLESIWKGGIKDQVGNGIARYSVTRDWSLPHFEKMLYDNAQLLPLYLDAYLITNARIFLHAVHDVASYLTTKPMVSDLGGIHASEDADSLPTAQASNKSEGAYYVWTLQELKDVLDQEEFDVCSRFWGVLDGGNIDQRFDAQGELVEQNTLCVQCEPAELAQTLNTSENDIQQALQSARQKLRSYREQNRPRPALDDKIVTSWNGLAIGGLARTGAALSVEAPDQAQAYLSAAKKAVSCIHEHLFDSKDGTLRRVYREGPGDTKGFADDYAFLIAGLIDLYEACFDSSYLEFADTLQQTQNRLFWDVEKHGFFSTPADQPDILIRVKDAMDNSEPSTNGMSANNLFRLGSLLNDGAYEKMARQTVAAFEVELGQHPGLFSGMMRSVVASKVGMKGLMVIGDGDAAEAALQKSRGVVRPNCTVLRLGSGVNSSWLKERNQLLRDVDQNREMVQLCEGGVCKLLDADEVLAIFR
ncbi:hypothetical protein K431DRAFT_234548 [Polychaeton citri CBS 116435]|uniref:Spermatogenesis-associated protein 20-like TRX domain-containing protein n=1 Tax=Polychaeton citri CBS 116435 TaxID=1314669 RepID=A0A9P4UKZ1_9PEZI|nr:hypothetical protein K431DRAFT_234548 [Polychaeton citri CBS 116435]